MDHLQIEIVSTDNLATEVGEQIDLIDQLAIAEVQNDDPEFNSIDWSSPLDCMALGYRGGELVTLLGLLRREILVGGEPIGVVGVGGVATHPHWQKRGFASALLQAARKYMREKMNASFGLLVCADERRPFYERLGWQRVAPELFFTQNAQRRSLKACVMILPLTEQRWRAGEIDLCGLPW